MQDLSTLSTPMFILICETYVNVKKRTHEQEYWLQNHILQLIQ